MTTDSIRRAPYPAASAVAALVLIAVGLVAWLIGGGEALAAGWLAGWLFCLSVTTGAALWFVIAALTGGAWIEAGSPALQALARATPLVAITGLLFIAAGPSLYPWWRGAPVFSLSPASFAGRTVLWLAMFSALGLLATRRLRTGTAALLLLLYVPAVTLAGTDWVLSRASDFGNTLVGAGWAATQLTLGLAAAAAAGLRTDQPQAVADCGGLMLATILGTGYLLAMQYLVLWTGNIPGDAAWYGARAAGAGPALLILSVLLACVLPFFALLSSRKRGSASWLRWVGAAILVGGFAHFLWLAAPGARLAEALAALATTGLLALAFFAPSPERRRTP